jgi:hypothetical protein
LSNLALVIFFGLLGVETLFFRTLSCFLCLGSCFLCFFFSLLPSTFALIASPLGFFFFLLCFLDVCFGRRQSEKLLYSTDNALALGFGFQLLDFFARLLGFLPGFFFFFLGGFGLWGVGFASFGPALIFPSPRINLNRRIYWGRGQPCSA